MNRTIYSKAPILEAVLDFRFERLPPSSLHVIDQFAATLEGFRKVGDLFEGSVDLEEQSSTSEKIGVQLASKDNTYILLLSLEGFKCSRMRPYTDWESFREDTQPHWLAFTSLFPVLTYRRIALRYINSLLLPIATSQDYLNIRPQFPESEAFGNVKRHLSQAILGQDDIESIVVLNFGRTDEGKAGIGTYIIDIDIFKEIKDKHCTGNDLWTAIEKLRERKDAVFESCITDSTRALIA